MASDPPGPSRKEKLQQSDSTKSLVAKLKEEFIKPVTKDNILYHYLPLHGVICYSAMSVNVMNPSLFSECCPKKDITNFLLFGSVGGVALYAYKRPHLQNLELLPRTTYSAFGAVMFTFGSVLIWAVMRSVVPENAFVGSAIGLLSAAGLVKCGSSYCNAIDQQVPSLDNEQPD
ncbi:hypothetical protein R5R35_003195 [Gryllus longicercus]|uniref:Uncharacterized protein n=1 Tax=Gryllus longicercus TaxID=2509291 RepID=A0AAN9VMF0_9ORTH